MRLVQSADEQNHGVATSDVDFNFGPAGNSGAFSCSPLRRGLGLDAYCRTLVSPVICPVRVVVGCRSRADHAESVLPEFSEPFVVRVLASEETRFSPNPYEVAKSCRPLPWQQTTVETHANLRAFRFPDTHALWQSPLRDV